MFLQLDAQVDALLIDGPQQQKAQEGHPRYVGAAIGVAAASRSAYVALHGSSPQAGTTSPLCVPLPVPTQRQGLAAEPEEKLQLGRQGGGRQLICEAGADALTNAQRTWTQRFRDSRLEERFRLHQARMLHPVRALAHRAS